MERLSSQTRWQKWLPTVGFCLVAIGQLSGNYVGAAIGLVAAIALSPPLLSILQKHVDKQYQRSVQVAIACVFAVLLVGHNRSLSLNAGVGSLPTFGWGTDCIKDCEGTGKIGDPDIIYRVYSCDNLARLYDRIPPSVTKKEWHKRVKARAEVLGCSNL